MYKAFLRSLLTYASPGWFPFLSATNITKLKRLHRAASRTISGCLSSSLSHFSSLRHYLLPLRVTLTHFTLSSYERALRLPTSFLMSGLARLGVKLRLRRSSWKAFASTHPPMLHSTSPSEALFACPPSPPLNLPSFTAEFTPSSPCSRRDPPLSRQGAALAHLDHLPPQALFLFLLAKATMAYFVAPRPLSPFRQAQYVQVFPLKPAPFCTLFAGLGNFIKSVTSLLLSNSRHPVSSVFHFTSISLAGPVFYRNTMGPRTLVSSA